MVSAWLYLLLLGATSGDVIRPANEVRARNVIQDKGWVRVGIYDLKMEHEGVGQSGYLTITHDYGPRVYWMKGSDPYNAVPIEALPDVDPWDTSSSCTWDCWTKVQLAHFPANPAMWHYVLVEEKDHLATRVDGSMEKLFMDSEFTFMKSNVSAGGKVANREECADNNINPNCLFLSEIRLPEWKVFASPPDSVSYLHGEVVTLAWTISAQTGGIMILRQIFHGDILRQVEHQLLFLTGPNRTFLADVEYNPNYYPHISINKKIHRQNDEDVVTIELSINTAEEAFDDPTDIYFMYLDPIMNRAAIYTALKDRHTGAMFPPGRQVMYFTDCEGNAEPTQRKLWLQRGQEKCILCRVIGDDINKVHLVKDGILVITNGDREIVELTDSFSTSKGVGYYMREVSDSDAGKYECVATMKDGRIAKHQMDAKIGQPSSNSYNYYYNYNNLGDYY